MNKYTKRFLSVLLMCCMMVLAFSGAAMASGGTGDARLASLEISPGTLEPEFSSDVYEYSVEVEADCDKLLVNASTVDSGARMVIAGNDSLQAGTNTVIVNVTAADGVTTARYTITVNRAAGGDGTGSQAEETSGETQTETPAESQGGDELPSDPLIASGISGGGSGTAASSGTVTSAGRTYTLSEPNEGLVPSGFTAVDVAIGDQTVKGWTFPSSYEADGFYLLYGSDQDGNTSFFIYDQEEETVITAPAGLLSMGDESAIYQSQLRSSQESYQSALRQRLWIIIGLAVLCVILLIALTASMTRNRHSQERYAAEMEEDPVSRERERARRYEEDDYDEDHEDDYDEDHEDGYAHVSEPASRAIRPGSVRTIPREPEPLEEEEVFDLDDAAEPFEDLDLDGEDEPLEDLDLNGETEPLEDLDGEDAFPEDPVLDEGPEVPEEEDRMEPDGGLPPETEPEELFEDVEDLEFLDLDQEIPQLDEDDLEEIGEPEEGPVREEPAEADDLDSDFDLLDALLSDSVRSGKPEGADSIVNRAAEKAGRGTASQPSEAPVNPVRELKKTGSQGSGEKKDVSGRGRSRHKVLKPSEDKKQENGGDDFEILDL